MAIPKPKGKTRKLSLPRMKDKIILNGMAILLRMVFEPTFSPKSHGFRKGKSCHTALWQIRGLFQGVTWVIEGDISGCFDNLNHRLLMRAIKTQIDDGPFEDLL